LRRRALDIALDDPPARAGTLHLGQIQALLLGDPARQRRGEDAFARRAGRSGRGRFRGWGGLGLGCVDFWCFGLRSIQPSQAQPSPAEPSIQHPRRLSRAIGVLTFTPSEPSGDEDVLDHALVDRLDLHGRLVGLDSRR
jgi:hypothetical protein